MTTRLNLIAGLANSACLAAIGFAVVPFYLRHLGFEAYGLIGLLTTAQVLFSLLDVGLTPAITREVSKGYACGDLNRARSLLHTLSILYWTTAGVISVSAVLAAPAIARHWLSGSQLPAATVTNALALMGIVIAARWPIGLYNGVVLGGQRLVLFSVLSTLMSAASSLGGVAVLIWVSQRIEALFLWQAAAGIAYAFLSRLAAWRVIGRQSGLSFSTTSLRDVLRFSAGLSGVAVAALVLTQSDKLVLLRLLGLSAFGRYAIATMVASGLYLLIMPVFNAVYPRFTVLLCAGTATELSYAYRRGTRLFATALFSSAMAMMLLGEDFVRVWTGDAELASSIAPVTSLLVAGSALHGVMFFPYALQLAHGATRLPVVIAMSLVAIHLPLTVALAWSFGLEGAALSWLVLHVLYVVLGGWLTHRQLLPGLGGSWLAKDVGLPLAVSLLFGLCLFEAFRYSGLAPIGKAAAVGAALACNWGAMWAIDPTPLLRLRRALDFLRA